MKKLFCQTTSLMDAVSERGYTGHEHISNVGLIHMGGRVYDPTIARFISADPNVTDPNNLQSYNRYSYVINSPFRYTDPTGYDFWSELGDALEGVVKIVVGVTLIVIDGSCVAATGSTCTGGLLSSAGVALIDDGFNGDFNDQYHDDGKDRRKNYTVGAGFQTDFDPVYSAANRNAPDSLSEGVIHDETRWEIESRVDSYFLQTYGIACEGACSSHPIPDWQWGDPLPQGFVNAISGFGDGVFKAVTLGFGDLDQIRSALGINGGLDYDSAEYSNAVIIGGIHGGSLLGVGLGQFGRGRAGFEYSHFIPQRYLNKLNISREWKSALNGTYVPKKWHMFTDKYRYRFMPRKQKAIYGPRSPIPQGAQQLLRTPPIYVGGAIGGSLAEP